MKEKTPLDLYQKVVLEHNRSPIGVGTLETFTHQAEGFNPICGDQVTIQLRVEASKIQEIKFQAQCCALCRASASILVKEMSNLALTAANQTLSSFKKLLEGHTDHGILGDALAFAIISSYPARAKCVKLPWRTFEAALTNSKDSLSKVSTEE